MGFPPALANVVEVTKGPLDLDLTANGQALQVLTQLPAIWEPGVLVLPVHLQGRSGQASGHITLLTQ